MGEPVLIYGKSGSGKSRSIMNFGQSEIFLLNTIGKRLPFKKQFRYMKTTQDVNVIKAGLSKMPCKTAIIDDAGYLMTSTFMSGHTGKDQFTLYNNIGNLMWDLINYIKYSLPGDVFVYIIMHEERNDFGETKLKTIGKLLDQKVCLEGMVTICLRAAVIEGRHVFLTQAGDNDIAKSPEGMFEPVIDNDLKFVDDTIRDYWGIAKNESEEKVND